MERDRAREVRASELQRKMREKEDATAKEQVWPDPDSLSCGSRGLICMLSRAAQEEREERVRQHLVRDAREKADRDQREREERERRERDRQLVSELTRRTCVTYSV